MFARCFVRGVHTEVLRTLKKNKKPLNTSYSSTKHHQLYEVYGTDKSNGIKQQATGTETETLSDKENTETLNTETKDILKTEI